MRLDLFLSDESYGLDWLSPHEMSCKENFQKEVYQSTSHRAKQINDFVVVFCRLVDPPLLYSNITTINIWPPPKYKSFIGKLK